MNSVDNDLLPVAKNLDLVLAAIRRGIQSREFFEWLVGTKQDSALWSLAYAHGDGVTALLEYLFREFFDGLRGGLECNIDVDRRSVARQYSGIEMVAILLGLNLYFFRVGRGLC